MFILVNQLQLKTNGQMNPLSIQIHIEDKLYGMGMVVEIK